MKDIHLKRPVLLGIILFLIIWLAVYKGVPVEGSDGIEVNWLYLPNEERFTPDIASTNWYHVLPRLHLDKNKESKSTKKKRKKVLFMTWKFTANLSTFHLFSGITCKKRGKSTWWCNPGPWLDWGSVRHRGRSKEWCWNRSGQAAKRDSNQTQFSQ